MTAVADIASQEKFQKKFSYHHGDLRGALLRAALDILASEGAELLSLRTLAKKTGVTQAAPYSHFRDKEELMAAVAEQGFQKLALKMAGDATGAGGVRGRIERLMTSYIEFAIENRALFGVMFGPDIADMKKHPTLAMTAGKSYALFSAALMKREDNANTAFLTAAIWSLCHGLTGLIIEKRLDLQKLGAKDIPDFVSRNVDLFASQL